MDAELLLLLVLMLGVGLGSMATAWVTRRPETVAHFQRDRVHLSDPATPKQMDQVRTLWERLASTAPDTTSVAPEPDQ